jgi:hypothetical protein
MKPAQIKKLIGDGRHRRIPEHEPLKGVLYNGPMMKDGGMNRDGRVKENGPWPTGFWRNTHG